MSVVLPDPDGPMMATMSPADLHHHVLAIGRLILPDGHLTGPVSLMRVAVVVPPVLVARIVT